MQASEKSGLAAKKLASVKRREERRWVPLSIFSNTSVHPLPCQLPEKLFLVSKCQMWKCQTVGCRRDSHAHHVCMTLHARSQAIDLSVDKTDQSQDIPTAGIPEWSIENNAYRLHITVSPQPPRGFRATFLDSPSLLSWSLEQAMLIWTLMFGTENTWTV